MSGKFRRGIVPRSGKSEKAFSSVLWDASALVQPFFSSFLFVTFITSKSLQRLLRALDRYKTI